MDKPTTHMPDDLMDVKPEEDMLTGKWYTITGLDGKPVQIHIAITQADGVKCPRCWKIHSVRCNFDNLCDRCVDALLMDHPTHESIPGIKAALDEQRKHWNIK